ncbi:sensor histidine kinase, partial [Staphylococcus croceilyticus]
WLLTSYNKVPIMGLFYGILLVLHLILQFVTFNHQVNIYKVIQKTLNKWSYLLTTQNINVHITFDSEEIYWLGDQLWYERLFDNIISNIYKHSKATKINIVLFSNFVEIKDNGVGFNNHVSYSKGLTIIKDICKNFSLNLNIETNENGTLIKISNEKGE